MSTEQHIIDLHDFSTETGTLRPGESDFRSEICLNGRWDFQPVELPDGFKAGESIPQLPLPQPDKWESVKLKVPSPWNINGFVDQDGIPGGDFNCYPSYPESWKHAKMGWLRRSLRVPEGWAGQDILLHFEAVCGYCQVYIDGRKVGEHFDNSMPKSYAIDDFVTPGMDHELCVGIRAPELHERRPWSHQVYVPDRVLLQHEHHGYLAGCDVARCAKSAPQGRLCTT